MKRLLAISFLLLTISNLGACQNGGAAKSGDAYSTLPVDSFERKLAGTPGAQLVDVRTSDEYSGGHLKNAVNMNVNREDYKQQFATLDKSRAVFVYCKAGSRSARAAKIMHDMGFKEIYNLDGGIMSWENAGKQIANGATPPATGMTMEEFNKLVSVKNYVLVDYNALWCEPCKKMKPVLERLADVKKEKLRLIKLDADENKLLMKEKMIGSIPYLELYRDGKLVWKHEGFIEESQLLKETGL